MHEDIFRISLPRADLLLEHLAAQSDWKILHLQAPQGPPAGRTFRLKLVRRYLPAGSCRITPLPFLALHVTSLISESAC